LLSKIFYYLINLKEQKMNRAQQCLYFFIMLLITNKLCYSWQFVTINITQGSVRAAAPIVADFANKLQAGLTCLGSGFASIGTGLTVLGVGLGVGIVIGGGIYFFHRRHVNKLARELFEREMRIKEEQARIALRNATIRNNILIGVTATASGIGIGYAIYRLYRSILMHRQEQDLRDAKEKLLDTLTTANHEERGQFELPTSCTTHACKLLALPGGNQALSDIVSAYRKPILQQAGAPAAMLAQPN
jgi:F0F1-type ATP synthase membrane subunit c/vacuolar-type H+-ATPase subunit K